MSEEGGQRTTVAWFPCSRALRCNNSESATSDAAVPAAHMSSVGERPCQMSRGVLRVLTGRDRGAASAPEASFDWDEIRHRAGTDTNAAGAFHWKRRRSCYRRIAQ